MMLLPIALLAGGAALVWALSNKDKAENGNGGPISTYTLSNGSTVNIPFNSIISLPGQAPALPETMNQGLWTRWMAFANAPDTFNADTALQLEYDLAEAGAWYEAAYISQAITSGYFG